MIQSMHQARARTAEPRAAVAYTQFAPVSSRMRHLGFLSIAEPQLNRSSRRGRALCNRAQTIRASDNEHGADLTQYAEPKQGRLRNLRPILVDLAPR